MSLLEVAALTNVGLVRKFNEDSVLIGTELLPEEGGSKRVALPIQMGVLIVADGMGGHRNGALASRTALSAIRELPLDGIDPWRWENFIQLANDAVYDAMERVPSSRGMGTTIAGVAVGQDQVAHFNVGDSRVYRHSTNALVRLTLDDVPLGTGPRTMRTSHQITQSLGGRTSRTSIRPHVGMGPPLGWDDTLLICSDGLTDMVSEQLINATIADERDLERCASNLLGLALHGGGRDNISVILARRSVN